MIGRSVLDDFQGPNAGALVAGTADKQPAVTRRCEQDGADCGQVSPRIKIAGDADRMPEHFGVGIGFCIDIDAAHQLHDLACFRPIVCTCLVEIFADEVEQISNFRVFHIRKSYKYIVPCHH